MPQTIHSSIPSEIVRLLYSLVFLFGAMAPVIAKFELMVKKKVHIFMRDLK